MTIFLNMKFIKSFKLFESLVYDTKFWRFSRVEMPEGEYQPQERVMWGPENFNQSLIKLGFPDKSKCIHFMDSVAFNPEYKSSYGKYIYEITIDDNSHLGWSFVIPINDWLYKSNDFDRAHRGGNQVIKQILDTEFKDFNIYNDKQSTDQISKFLVDYGVIGTGTLDDLKSSPLYGKEKLFIWTDNKVNLKRWIEPSKEPKKYKTEKLLTSYDFTSRGILPENIAKFYQSELGKSTKGLSREEALETLDRWILENK